jgi:predicted amidohydrolase YtcJ
MRRTLLVTVLGALVLGAGTPNAAAPAPADLVFRHGAVYTVDGPRSWAEAVAVTQGRIVFVGTDAAAAAWIGPLTRVVDLTGKMLLPAFHDSHVHPVSGGIEAVECNLHGLASPDEVLAAIRAYAVAHPQAPWIRGGGWELTVFPAGNPSKALLDGVVPDRPAFLESSDGHSAWANSKALAVAGITKATPDPPHGRIERDASGEPSGTLREEAVHLVSTHLPPRTAKEYEDGLRKGLDVANAFGLTSLEEASASKDDLEAYAALDAAGALSARVSASIYVDTDKGLADVPRLKELRAHYRGQRFRADAAKIFADGVIETRTAAVLEPYIGFGTDRGKTNLDPADFRALATVLDREGFQIHVHAIGDRAVRDTLDAFEAAQKANGVRDSRHHIAHLELIDPADVPRFRRLGVIANFQPFWANGDEYITKMTEPELGPARSRWIYPIASVEKAGGVTTFGSDWSVSSMNPLDGIEVAITHREPTKGPGSAWLPEERIDLPDAIAGYTIRGAYLDFTEKETGSIEVGKAADLIVLDRNLFEIPPSQIHEAKVLWTLLDGKEVYRAPGF